MRDSLMYRLCYYRFGEVRTRHDQPSGFDTVRNAEIGLKHFDLKYFREAYSSERWIVRIYEVLPLPNREERTKSRFDLKKNKPLELPKDRNSGADTLFKLPQI